jgi:hypothetical protein
LQNFICLKRHNGKPGCYTEIMTTIITFETSIQTVTVISTAIFQICYFGVSLWRICYFRTTYLGRNLKLKWKKIFPHYIIYWV